MTTTELLFWIACATLLVLAGYWLGVRAPAPSEPEPEPGVTVLVRNRAPLPPEDLQRILAGWDVSDERWQAIEDVFDLCFGELLADVTRRGATSEDRHYASGALEALRYFDGRVREYRAKPMERRGPEGPIN